MKCFNNFEVVVSTSNTFFIVFYHIINLWQTSVTGAPSSELLLQQQQQPLVSEHGRLYYVAASSTRSLFSY